MADEVIDSVRLYRLDKSLKVNDKLDRFEYGYMLPADQRNKIIGYSVNNGLLDLIWNLEDNSGQKYSVCKSGKEFEQIPSEHLFRRGNLITIFTGQDASHTFLARIEGAYEMSSAEFVAVTSKYDKLVEARKNQEIKLTSIYRATLQTYVNNLNKSQEDLIRESIEAGRKMERELAISDVPQPESLELMLWKSAEEIRKK
jgi:hypothetical protein